MKRIFYAMFFFNVLLVLGCKKQKDKEVNTTTDCEANIQLDSISSRIGDESTILKLYCKNIFCNQDEVKLILTKHNTCDDISTTEHRTLEKTDYADKSELEIPLWVGNEPGTKKGSTTLKIQLEVNGKKYNLPDNNTFTFSKGYYIYNNYVTEGDSISTTVYQPQDDGNNMESMYFNSIEGNVARSYYSQPHKTYFVAVPSGLSEGIITTRGVSSCGNDFFKEGEILNYTSKPYWFYIKSFTKENGYYQMAIQFNKATNRTFTVKLKDKVSGQLYTINSSGYGSGAGYKSPTYDITIGTYSGTYDIVVTSSDGTIYENVNGADVTFE